MYTNETRIRALEAELASVYVDYRQHDATIKALEAELDDVHVYYIMAFRELEADCETLQAEFNALKEAAWYYYRYYAQAS